MRIQWSWNRLSFFFLSSFLVIFEGPVWSLAVNASWIMPVASTQNFDANRELQKKSTQTQVVRVDYNKRVTTFCPQQGLYGWTRWELSGYKWRFLLHWNHHIGFDELQAYWYGVLGNSDWFRKAASICRNCSGLSNGTSCPAPRTVTSVRFPSYTIARPPTCGYNHGSLAYLDENLRETEQKLGSQDQG